MSGSHPLSHAKTLAWLDRRLEEVQPESFQRVMGLQSPELVQRLLSNDSIREVLKHDLSKQLERSAGPLPSMSRKEQGVYDRLSWMTPQQMARLDRVMSVVLNRKSAVLQTSSAAVSEILAWADVPDALALLRRPPLPPFDRIPPAAEFELEALEIYAAALPPFLMGLLPQQMILQRSLRFVDADASAREPLPETDAARMVLLAGLSEIFSILQPEEPKNAEV